MGRTEMQDELVIGDCVIYFGTALSVRVKYNMEKLYLQRELPEALWNCFLFLALCNNADE